MKTINEEASNVEAKPAYKTSHQLARELLALPDLPVVQFYENDRSEGYADVVFDMRDVATDKDGDPNIWLYGKKGIMKMIVFRSQ